MPKGGRKMLQRREEKNVKRMRTDRSNITRQQGTSSSTMAIRRGPVIGWKNGRRSQVELGKPVRAKGPSDRVSSRD